MDLRSACATESNTPTTVTSGASLSPMHSPEFWREFVDRDWTRAVGGYPGAGRDLLSTAQVFEAVRDASDHYRFDPQGTRLNFYLGSEVIKDCGHLLPAKCDLTPESYNSRVRHLLGGKDYTLLVANPHVYSATIFDQVQPLLDLLYERAGHPLSWGGWVDTAVFLGEYARTPFGVHYGPMDVMTFPLVGVKRFRTWSAEYALAHPDIKDRLEYDEHLPASRLYTVQENDVIYWPSAVWHIAEGGDGFVMSWSLGLWRKQPSQEPQQLIAEIISELLKTVWEPSRSAGFPVAMKRGEVLTVPDAWGAVVGDLGNWIDEGLLHDALYANWLKALSARGFKKIPPLRQEQVEIRGVCRLRCQASLHWRSVEDQLMVGCNGHVAAFVASADMRDLLGVLARGECLQIGPEERCEPPATLLAFLTQVNGLDWNG